MSVGSYTRVDNFQEYLHFHNAKGNWPERHFDERPTNSLTDVAGVKQNNINNNGEEAEDSLAD